MKIQVIAIGNSKGIRIPSSLLKLCHISSEVDLDVKGNSILIRPIQKKVRDGWADAFKIMSQKKEELLLINDSSELKMEQWEW